MTDVARSRANARQNIDKGDITESYAADPVTVSKLPNEALATEYVCV